QAAGSAEAESPTPGERACGVLQELVKDKPDDALAWLAKFEFEQAHGVCSNDGAEPINALDRALKLAGEADAKTSSRVNLVAANVARENEDWEKARTYLKVSTEAEPKYYLPHLALAQVYLSEGGDEAQSQAID